MDFMGDGAFWDWGGQYLPFLIGGDYGPASDSRTLIRDDNSHERDNQNVTNCVG